MWNTNEIDDLQVFAAISDGSLPDVAAGYAVNIRPALMAEDLRPFVVTPSRPVRRWADDMGKVEIPLAPEDPERPGKLDFSRMSKAKPVFETVFLVFPDRAAAIASSLGKYWGE